MASLRWHGSGSRAQTFAQQSRVDAAARVGDDCGMGGGRGVAAGLKEAAGISACAPGKEGRRKSRPGISTWLLHERRAREEGDGADVWARRVSGGRRARCAGRWTQARGGAGPVAALLGRARGERAGEGAGLARWLGRCGSWWAVVGWVGLGDGLGWFSSIFFFLFYF